jgi:hypothetical protein
MATVCTRDTSPVHTCDPSPVDHAITNPQDDGNVAETNAHDIAIPSHYV